MQKMPLIFSDYMVLQRQKPIAVWGKACAGKRIQVRLIKGASILSEAETAANGSGDWALSLPAAEAAHGLRLEVMADGEAMVYHDILVGEVWIAGGQSNMEYSLYFDAEKDVELGKPGNPDIRFFDYPEVSYEGALEASDLSDFGYWRPCRKEDIPWFSAVGYYFARRLEADLGIPIGIVGYNWGGTSASCWMDQTYLEGTPGEIWLKDYQKGIEGVDLEDYHRGYRSDPVNDRSHFIPGDCPQSMYPGLSREEQLDIMAKGVEQTSKYSNLIGPDHPWRPGGLYHTMLRKVAPYTARGVLWYQDEADSAYPGIYGQVLTSMIQNWRDLWQEELPFLLVQLAPFEAWMDGTGKDYPIVRECQEAVANRVPGVYLCSSSDCGMRWDIHPKHKRPIGERLALLALGHIYRRDILCDAPVLCAA